MQLNYTDLCQKNPSEMPFITSVSKRLAEETTYLEARPLSQQLRVLPAYRQH
jgi:hypothetical protein